MRARTRSPSAVDGLDAVGRLDGSLRSGGGGAAVSGGVPVVIAVVVLGPLVVIGLNRAGVLLVVVGLGVDGVVRLAPSAVVVRAVSLLGPLVVVVAGAGGGTAPGCSIVVLLGVASLLGD